MNVEIRKRRSKDVWNVQCDGTLLGSFYFLAPWFITGGELAKATGNLRSGTLRDMKDRVAQRILDRHVEAARTTC